MRLSNKEKNIISTFKREIEKKFPEEIIKVLIFGSKARRDAVNLLSICFILIFP